MAESSTFLATKRYAVVTGANKGIGFEICRQLASKGVTVVLTSRDEKRGLEALRKLKEESSPALPGEVIFHQLDVTDSKSAESLAGFIRARFGRLDILVNNAGVNGFIMDLAAYAKAVEDAGGVLTDEKVWKSIAKETDESIRDCIETNYYGTKRMCEALLPLLQLSTAPRIVNVSSDEAMLKKIPGEAIRKVLADTDNLNEDRIDGILRNFVDDFRQGQLVANGWPEEYPAYKVSKAACNAYTRILAKNFPSVLVNCVCPGFVQTDMSCYSGDITAAEGAESPVRLALLPEGGPTGVFFVKSEVGSF